MLGTYNYLFYFFTDHFVYRLRRIFSDCWNEVHQIWSYRRPHDWWLSMAKEEFDTFSPPRCGVNEVEATDIKSFLLRSSKTWGMSFSVLESSIACHTETVFSSEFTVHRRLHVHLCSAWSSLHSCVSHNYTAIYRFPAPGSAPFFINSFQLQRDEAQQSNLSCINYNHASKSRPDCIYRQYLMYRM